MIAVHISVVGIPFKHTELIYLCIYMHINTYLYILINFYYV